MHLLEIAASLGEELRTQTLMAGKVVLISYSVTNCEIFAKLLCLSELNALHLEDGNYYQAQRFALRIK